MSFKKNFTRASLARTLARIIAGWMSFPWSVIFLNLFAFCHDSYLRCVQITYLYCLRYLNVKLFILLIKIKMTYVTKKTTSAQLVFGRGFESGRSEYVEFFTNFIFSSSVKLFFYAKNKIRYTYMLLIIRI